MWLKYLLRSELVDSQFFDYFEQIHFFGQLSCRVFVQEVFSLLLGSTTTTNFLVEFLENPEAAVSVRECFSVFDFALNLFLVIFKAVPYYIIVQLFALLSFGRVELLEERIFETQALNLVDSKKGEPDCDCQQSTKATEDVSQSRPY